MSASRKGLSEFVFKCGSLFWGFLCCFPFLFPAAAAAVKFLERLIRFFTFLFRISRMKNYVKEDEVIKDAEDEDKKTLPMIFPAEKQSPPEFSFSFLRREFGNSGTEVKSPVTTFTTNSNRYQFVSDVCGFMEEKVETRGFVVEEMFLSSSTDSSEFNSPTADDFFHLREESCDEEEADDDDLNETLELKQHAENYTIVEEEEEEMSDENDKNFLEFVPRKDIISFSSTLDLKINQFHHIQNTQITQTTSSSDDDDDDYIELEPYSPDSINPNQGFKGGKQSEPMKEEEEEEHEEIDNKKWESDTNNAVEDEEEEEEEFDILLEHQNLVKQMKKEVKNSWKVKGGLPTISEEGECAILKDLKPLKLEDNKFDYKDRMQEIQKFYKSYADKMKKLDILNYQTLQAISILQLKDCDQLFKQQNKKASIPNFLSFKERRVYADMTLKSNINDLHRDLELVYVGQVCLSWEILRWQYGKLMQLQQHGDHSRRQYSYNQVASEFQQFQVLLQRFVEDERFRPPRIHNYVESRRFCHALLHVPLIKDDGRDKKDRLKEVDDSISVAKLVVIVKESMEAFWEFVRADKDENHTVVSKGCLPQLHLLHDDDDPDLVINIKASLEKKERKLKVIHKAGNCIVKMFQKLPADDEQSSEMIMAQVELKLISRVLCLSRWSTDQLRWCERKLNCINIVNRRIYMEPCFSLFPC